MNNIKEYSKAFSEVDEIISILDESIKSKIPKDILEVISENKDKNYIFEFDHSKPIDEQAIGDKAKAILTVLYKEYICSDDERKKWKEFDMFRLKKMEELKKKKYNGNY